MPTVTPRLIISFDISRKDERVRIRCLFFVFLFGHLVVQRSPRSTKLLRLQFGRLIRNVFLSCNLWFLVSELRRTCENHWSTKYIHDPIAERNKIFSSWINEAHCCEFMFRSSCVLVQWADRACGKLVFGFQISDAVIAVVSSVLEFYLT